MQRSATITLSEAAFQEEEEGGVGWFKSQTVTSQVAISQVDPKALFPSFLFLPCAFLNNIILKNFQHHFIPISDPNIINLPRCQSRTIFPSYS